MFQIAGERDDAPIDADVFVNFPVTAPPAAASIEQTQHAVGIGVAVAEELSEILGRARKSESAGVGESVLLHRLDGCTQCIWHALVGVETEHPIVLRRAHGEILLRTIARERMRDHARAACDGATLRSVCRSRIDHEDFVAEAERLDARVDAVGLVQRDDAGRDRRTRGNRHKIDAVMRLE